MLFFGFSFEPTSLMLDRPGAESSNTSDRLFTAGLVESPLSRLTIEASLRCGRTGLHCSFAGRLMAPVVFDPLTVQDDELVAGEAESSAARTAATERLKIANIPIAAFAMCVGVFDRHARLSRPKRWAHRASSAALIELAGEFRAVVRRFLRNGNIMGMALPHAGVRDLNEPCFLAQLLDRFVFRK